MSVFKKVYSGWVEYHKCFIYAVRKFVRDRLGTLRVCVAKNVQIIIHRQHCIAIYRILYTTFKLVKG